MSIPVSQVKMFSYFQVSISTTEVIQRQIASEDDHKYLVGKDFEESRNPVR